MTALCGVTRSYGQFVLVRMGVGLAEAGFAPAAHSLLSDLYPRGRRPAAMGVFALGVPFGIMFGLSIGGSIAQRYDWRTALLIVGMPGLVISLLFYLLAHEPTRGASDPVAYVEEGAAADGAAPVSTGSALRTLVRRPAFVQVILGTSASSFALAGLYAWLPSFLIRVDGLSLAQAGLSLGVLTGCSGLIGTSLGGWQAARLNGHGMQAMLWLPIAGLVLSIPLFIAALLSGSVTTTLWLLLLPMTLANLFVAPSIALTQSLAPVEMRATAGAIYIVSSNVVGVAFGPAAVGTMSDVFASLTGNTSEGLRWALVCAAILLVWGVGHWVLAARALIQEKCSENDAAIISSVV